jgi:hypothetical protein
MNFAFKKRKEQTRALFCVVQTTTALICERDKAAANTIAFAFFCAPPLRVMNFDTRRFIVCVVVVRK